MTDRDSPSQTLLVLRLLWGGSLVVQSMVAALVIVMLWSDETPQAGPPSSATWVYIAAAALLVLTPIGYFMRNEIYKANWREHTIAPGGYFTGNVALLGLMELVSWAAIIIAWVNGEALPAMYVAGGAILVQLINFPTGRPMRPHPPVVGKRDRQ